MCIQVITVCKNCNQVDSSYQRIYKFCEVMCQRVEKIYKAERICISCDLILNQKLKEFDPVETSYSKRSSFRG